jgi:hypothetical protein
MVSRGGLTADAMRIATPAAIINRNRITDRIMRFFLFFPITIDNIRPVDKDPGMPLACPGSFAY